MAVAEEELQAVSSHRFGDCELKPVERRLMVAGVPVTLGARAFDLLVALVERRGELVTRDELLDAAWPGLVVEPANVQVQVSALRKVIGNHAIATVPGLGYRFAMAVQGAPPAAFHAAPAEAASPALLGRDDDVRRLSDLLEQHRLVSIVGPGGIGKTSLAHALWTSHGDADKAWVDLAPLADPALVLESIWRALRLGTTDAADPLAALLGALQSRRLLLVLDNAEHLVDSIAGVVSAIHEHAPGVRTVVTSQSVLKAVGEQVYRLGPLSLPPADASLDEATRHGALQLLERRARQADRGFALNEANISSAIELCRRLDGMPLAIELAAARVSLLGLQCVAQRLGECLHLLGGASRTAPPRQQTLHAALQWSCGLLDAREQAVFQRSGVFAGGFSLELLEAVATDDTDPSTLPGIDRYDAIDALANMVDRSLVVVDAGDPPRYRLLEPARQYALERLREQPAEAARVMRRHAQALLELFERAYRECWFTADAPWRMKYGAEIDNLRAAIDHCVSRCAEPVDASNRSTDMVVALTGAGAYLLFWHHLDVAQELGQRLATACRLIDDATPARAAARLLRLYAGLLLQREGRIADAIPIARRALERARATAAPIEIYQSLWVLALCVRRADPAEMLACCDDMSRIEDPAWPPQLLHAGKDGLAFALEARGRLHEAWQARKDQIALAQRAGSERFEAFAKYRLIGLSLVLGRVDEAIARGHEVVAWGRASGQRRVLQVSLRRLMTSCLAAGDVPQARVAAEELLSLAQASDGDHVLAVDGLALLAALEGRCDMAARLLGRADRHYAQHGARREPIDDATRDAALRRLQAVLDAPRLAALMAEGASLDRADVCRLALTVR